MSPGKAYGDIKIYSPDNVLMFRTNEKKLNFYKRKELVEQIGDSSYRLKFAPAGLGHGSRNVELLEPRANKCVVCGDEDILTLTRHHVVPTRFRKYFPLHMKSNNHRYVVLVCTDCHHLYNYFEELKNQELSEHYKVKSLHECMKIINNNKRVIAGVASSILFSDFLPEERKDELRIKFTKLTNMEPTEDNLTKSFQKKYEPISDDSNFGKMIVDKVKNLYDFQGMWLKHFVDTMQPKYLPNDLNILMDL